MSFRTSREALDLGRAMAYERLIGIGYTEPRESADPDLNALQQICNNVISKYSNHHKKVGLSRKQVQKLAGIKK